MKRNLLIICGSCLTHRGSSTTCAASARQPFGTRSVFTCSIVSIVSSETRNGAVRLSSRIRGTLSSTHGMQSRQTITVTLELTNSPRRRKWSSRGTKNGRGFIPSKKPLRLNSASSESLDHYKIKGEKNEEKGEKSRNQGTLRGLSGHDPVMVAAEYRRKQDKENATIVVKNYQK